MARYRQHGLLGGCGGRIIASWPNRSNGWRWRTTAAAPANLLSKTASSSGCTWPTHWRADLLLLDEPTAGLDAHAQERYVGLVAEERAAVRW
ncbi:MAG: hypothetical protein R2755_08620 [Acidimicrobiales bacterium]